VIEVGVWTATAICMTVSLLISFWAGRRLEKFWLKFAFFLIASVIGFFLFPFLGGLWQGAAPQQEHLIDAAFRKGAWTVLGGVVTPSRGFCAKAPRSGSCRTDTWSR